MADPLVPSMLDSSTIQTDEPLFPPSYDYLDVDLPSNLFPQLYTESLDPVHMPMYSSSSSRVPCL